jgi:hypothetical protein
MAMTLNELTTAVLEELSVLPSGQVPTAEDAVVVLDAYKRWQRTAQNRQIIDWYDEVEDIPDGAETGVTLCVCNVVYRKFGTVRDPSWVVEGEAALADYMHNNYPAPQTQVENM